MLLEILFALSTQDAMAEAGREEQWVFTHTDALVSTLIERNSLVEDGPRKRFRGAFMGPGPTGEDGVIVWTLEADCEALTLTATDAVMYRPDHSLVGDIGSLPTQVIEPDSTLWGVLTSVCGGDYEQDGGWASVWDVADQRAW